MMTILACYNVSHNFLLIGVICYFRVQERLVLLGGLLIIIVGLVIWLPYGPGHPDVEIVGKQIHWRKCVCVLYCATLMFSVKEFHWLSS